jgi:alkylresorcinol/alkylpyrone synthase
MTQILTVQSAFPGRRYRQEELTRAVAGRAGLSGTDRALLDRLHRNAGVATRHTVLPLEEYLRLDGVGAANDRYIDEATALGERALRAALDAAGVGPADLDLLIVTSVTGMAVPSLDARLIPRLGLRPDIKRLPVFGLGCVAGAAALSRLHDYLLGWPGHTAALLAVELCSLTWPGNLTTADMVATGLFGDGAAALVAEGDELASQRARRRACPRVISTRSEVYPDSADTLGWRLGRDGFGIVLTADLSEVVERRLGEAATSFLAERGLTTDDITTWICHPGGPKVLDAVRKSLKLPDEALAASWKSLAEVGNLSSVSVLHILEQTMTEPGFPGQGRAAGQAENNGAFGLMIGLGPGVSAELVLLQW